MAQLTASNPHPPFATSETKSTTEYTGKVGYVFEDPANPMDKYMLVDCQESMVVGEVVVIDKDGNASQITSTSVGLVGVIVATVSGSDTIAYAQVEGESAIALMTSGVTTAAFLMIPATTDGGYFDLLTSTEANVVDGARCVVAPSTATSPAAGGGIGTAYLSRGGAWVYGIATNHGLTS